MLYSSECWAVVRKIERKTIAVYKKKKKQKTNVAEIRMLRKISGMTRGDKTRNENMLEEGNRGGLV